MMNWSEKIVSGAATVESVLVDLVAILAPWLAPVPSAYLVYRAAIEVLEWYPAVALAAAIAIEAIGVTSVVNALRLWDWNSFRSKARGEKGDRRAPFGLAAVVCGIYVVVTIGLTVLMDVIPTLAYVAPGIFPLLALVGGLNIALRNGQKQREAERSERLAKRSNKRSRSNKSVQANVQNSVQAESKNVQHSVQPINENVQLNGQSGVQATDQIVQTVKGFGTKNGLETANGVLTSKNGISELPDTDPLNVLLNAMKANPNASYRTLGEAAGRSKGWVHGHVQTLIGEGRVSKNGKGWEILNDES